MDKQEAVLKKTAQRYESLVYVALWLLILLLPFLNELVRISHEMEFSWSNVIRWHLGLLPFFIVFLLNNFLLVPRLLLKGKPRIYLLSIALIVTLFTTYRSMTYETRKYNYRTKIEKRFEPEKSYRKYKPTKYTFMGIRMPILLDFSQMLLLIGSNTAIIFIFRYARERQERMSLEKLRLNDEIRFLKTQINPHFFMNVLNNIHAMIELDPVKAQDMTIELSKLMRYILYDGDHNTTSLEKETNFIQSYVSMVSRRYSENKVKINLDIDLKDASKFLVPPLIFVSFVENAFKHGVSYQKKSTIDISFAMAADDKVCFKCRNTVPLVNSANTPGGVGLDNVNRRLDLIYGDRYSLTIEEQPSEYSVELIIPSI